MINQELVFRSLKGRRRDNQILLVLVRRCCWTQAAGGVAGQVNVGLCRASLPFLSK